MSHARPTLNAGRQMRFISLCSASICAAIVLGTAPVARLQAQTVPENGPILVKIEAAGEGADAQTLTLPLNKTAFIELPVEARDVVVGNPAIAEAVMRTTRKAFILGLSAGETTAVFFDAEGRKILDLNVRIGRDVTSLRNLIQQFAPGARVRLEPLGESLIVAGSAPNAADADKIISIARRFVSDPNQIVNLLSIEGKDQVLLKVRVVEMQRTVLKQLGVNASALLNSAGQTVLTLSTANAFSVAGSALGGLTGRVTNTTANRTIGGQIQAFERAGVVRTLAEPNLTAISGESATFLAGGEFPVPVAQNENGQISTEFKPFGIGLGFTPVVLSEGRISLRLNTEVSELTSVGSFQTPSVPIISGGVVVGQVPGLSIPALTVRRAQTTVELPSGGTMMVAGLIQESTRHALEGIPGAKDIPVFGALFRSKDFENSETELVIIVTPILVDPITGGESRTPADGFRAAGDFQSVFLGRINELYRAPSADVGSRTFSGPLGFSQQ